MLISATKVKVKAKPLDIPDSIVVDVTSLNIGDSFSFVDLPIPAGVSMVDTSTKPCVAVTAATIKKAAGEEGGAAA
jgi:large subunit ribosomal protein L25